MVDGKDPLITWEARRECQGKEKRDKIRKYELEAQEAGDGPTEISFGRREKSRAGRKPTFA